MKSTKVIDIQSEGELEAVAQYVIELMQTLPKVALLYGDLGAGKTTFVKYLVKKLGSTDDTSSPTYGLVNEYETAHGDFYHIDLYRINDTHEAVDMGIEDYLHSGTYCFVEWPQVIVPLVDDYVEIEIVEQENGLRRFSIR